MLVLLRGRNLLRVLPEKLQRKILKTSFIWCREAGTGALQWAATFTTKEMKMAVLKIEY